MTDPILVPVDLAGVAVTKTAFHDMALTQPIAAGETVNEGDTIWFAITVANTGASKLTETSIYDYIVGRVIFPPDVPIAHLCPAIR